MTKHFITIILFTFVPTWLLAQTDTYNQITPDGNITRGQRNDNKKGEKENKEIPKGIKVWTVDARFGDMQRAPLDTLSHMFMNSIFTTGVRGEYNTTGNLGAPRINRVFIDIPLYKQFIFTQPYDFFIKSVDQFHFTNTLSPFTNLTYNTCGDRTDGEDHFTAKFGVNAGKKIGVGFNFDYIYGRGYYHAQSTAHFNYTMYGSYLGDRYQAHLLLSTNHQKVAENGGISDDQHILHSESFNFQTTEIPTVLDENWNRNDNQHIFLTHRYSFGFNRKVRMTDEEIQARKFAIAAQKDKERREALKAAEDKDNPYESKEPERKFEGRPDDAKIMGMEAIADSITRSKRIAVEGKAQADSILTTEQKEAEDTSWLKNEYVPVTSFIHTLKFDGYDRIYQSYYTPDNYYAHTYYNNGKYAGDSIYDKTRHYSIKNTFAVSLLEGFNKWAKAGLKAFITSDYRHFSLPDSIGSDIKYRTHNLSIGAQISKTQGKTLHYNATAETWITGEDAGQLKIDGTVDLNFPLFGDTVTLAASGFFYRQNPTFYFRHYHSRHFWWDNSLDKIIHTRIQGLFKYQKTRTSLRVAIDEIKNHTYFAQSYNINEENDRTNNTVQVRQSGDAITLFTASLSQDVTLGPLNWESVVTWQKSTKSEVIPVPDLNIYTNLFLRFKIAKVLSCDLGADMFYFTKYYAPDYSPAIGQFTVQESDSRVEIGNRPIIDVYANFHLKHTRFFIMMSHVNANVGVKNYFLTPHYPLNGSVIRFGVSWNFFN